MKSEHIIKPASEHRSHLGELHGWRGRRIKKSVIAFLKGRSRGRLQDNTIKKCLFQTQRLHLCNLTVSISLFKLHLASDDVRPGLPHFASAPRS